MLTPSLAQEIASETSAIIGFNVMITDRAGIVLGNGDPSRVGTFHEASVEVVRTERAATHSGEQARRLSGVRHGITLPIRLDGAVVGTVGLTGAPSAVRRFGLVVRSQTELLLRESSLLTTRLVREKAVTDLLREIAHHDPEIVPARQVESAAHELGHDLRLRRVALVIETSRVPAVLRAVREALHDPQDVVGALGSSQVAVLHRLPRTDEVTAVRAAVDRVAGVLQHGAGDTVGVGDPAGDVLGLRDSIADATSALRLAAGGCAVARIGDHRMHQLLATVGVRARRRFGDAVLGPLPQRPDWAELRATALCWAEQGFHLVRAAEALHVHRNTLVYRLAKIERLTGSDLRDRKQALALYVACLMEQPS
ncbi:CdaR family transcriptional regulator [Pseudonocardia sp. TRM90224]|uniref:CdaR family transcriptional regulator n=1 Tax=Pseudonocardia sp. TRM90224 TaxID=2812678 RepID=UPI001E5766DC|nr:sugar diacid recognition domain-containing protein [Pseudonocardia sp. TRM90224]